MDFTTTTDLTSAASSADILAIFSLYIIPSIVIGLAVYVFSALALMAIAKRTNTPNGWLAWIPIGNFYLMTQIAQVPWWTLLVIFLSWIPVIGSLLMIGVMVWWTWKICERCHRPGWWSLLISFIPVVNLIMLGIVAWGKEEK